MNEILKIIPSILYFIIGCVSMIMAVKSLSSKQFLPFHQKAYGKRWDDVDKNLQDVIIALLRITGLGFLIVSLLMLSFPVVSYFNSNLYVKYAIPTIALIYCTGLFLINFSLFKKTKAETPWKNSLYAIVVIIIGIVISGL
jgi:uncharacterized membrane-anchored protein